MWTNRERAALRAFLKANPEFIEELNAKSPGIVTDKGVETAAMTGAAHAGAEALIEQIQRMADQGAEPQESAFIP